MARERKRIQRDDPLRHGMLERLTNDAACLADCRRRHQAALPLSTPLTQIGLELLGDIDRHFSKRHVLREESLGMSKGAIQTFFELSLRERPWRRRSRGGTS
jgi:hypothetical protein